MNATSFQVVIPARLESSRLPGKVLRVLAGKPMVQHVWERATASDASGVVIATDSEQVAATARAFGADVAMTSAACQSGTDRVAEVAAQRGWAGDAVVVNVQGDAPLLPPASIDRVAGLLLQHGSAAMATLCTPLGAAEDYADPNVVKVVHDVAGRALYFSRAPIPAAGHGAAEGWQSAFRHLGLYAYRVAPLHELAATEPCPLEQLERLEQLRALWLGMEIRVAADPAAHGPDVDTEADLARVSALLADPSA